MRRPSTQWSPTAVRVFEFFFRPWMRYELEDVHLAGLPRRVPEDWAVILAANHVGWWDAFILREVQRACAPEAPLLTVMQEGGLESYPFFRQMGVMGIDESLGGFRRALREVTSITERPPWVSIFPQGRLWPSWRRPLGFRRGVVGFARALAPALIVPVGIHYEVLRTPQPVAFACASEPIHVATPAALTKVQSVERGVTQALDRIHSVLEAFGEDAPLHWPSSPFEYIQRIGP